MNAPFKFSLVGLASILLTTGPGTWTTTRTTTTSFAQAFSIPNGQALHRQILWRLYNDVSPSMEGDGFDVESARKQLQSMFQEESQASHERDVDDKANANCGPNTNSNNNTKTTTRTTYSNGNNFNIQTFLKQVVSSDSKSDNQGPKNGGIPRPLDDSILPPLPPLSTIERDRRVVEIQLLEKLGTQDSVKELWDLWYSERGGLALARLQQADQLMGDPTSWQDCETSLLQLIAEYSIYFVEPVNRLATLYYLQGKYQESYHLCRLILLKLKPWHIGALAGIVQVCVNRGDRDEARYWATKRLPGSVAGSSFPPFDTSNGPVNPRRSEWVQEMVKTAKDMLATAEKTTRQIFGEPEEYYSNNMASNPNQVNCWEDELDGDVWQ